MNFNKSIVYLLGSGLFILASCTKELDQNPTDVFSDKTAYQSLEHIQLGVNEAYGRYSAYANDMYVNALLSDEAKIGKDNSGQGALTYRYQFGADATTGGDVLGAFYSYYSLVDQVNTVLENIPNIPSVTSETNRKNELKGQLLGLRAIAHFSLLQSYADRYDPAKPGVPYMLQRSTFGKPSRNTIGEVISLVEKDFADAKALLPTVTAATFTDTVINQVNIAAFQSRVALYKRDYQAAIDFATTVINSNAKPLATGTTFDGIWTDANNAEVLFRRRYSTGSGIGSLWTTTGGSIYIAPSDKLVAAYGTGDRRKAAYIGGSGTGTYVNKFYTSSRGGRVVDIKAIRIAEMYLIRAEAYAKLATPNLTSGTADLNTVRAGRITGYTAQTFATANDLITAVLDERFKELAFEGHRWFDLKRNNLPVQRLASDAATGWQTLAANDYRWLLPIPRLEINVNPNIVQNPNYN